MANPQEGIDSYSIYVAVSGGTWETVSYQGGTIIKDFSARIPFGTTRVYVKAISGGAESPVKIRSFLKQRMVMNVPGDSRGIEDISYW